MIGRKSMPKKCINAYHEANAQLWEGNLQANLEHLLAPKSHNNIVEDFDEKHDKILLVDVGGGRGQSLKNFPELYARFERADDRPRLAQSD